MDAQRRDGRYSIVQDWSVSGLGLPVFETSDTILGRIQLRLIEFFTDGGKAAVSRIHSGTGLPLPKSQHYEDGGQPLAGELRGGDEYGAERLRHYDERDGL